MKEEEKRKVKTGGKGGRGGGESPDLDLNPVLPPLCLNQWITLFVWFFCVFVGCFFLLVLFPILTKIYINYMHS